MPARRPTSTAATSAPTAGAGGSGFGSSLGASLVVHGAVLATLALSMRPWAAPQDARQGQEFSAFLAATEPPPPPEPTEELEPIEELDEPEEVPFEELELPPETMREFAPEGPAPSPRPGTSLLETVVYPRVVPIARDDVEVDEPPVEPPVEPTVTPAEPEPAETAPGPAAVDASPEPLEGACPPPPYPPVAERRGWTGTVVLLIDVAVDGTVTDVRIESSSGYGVLDDAAERAVRAWRFSPALRAGEPAAATVRKPIRFGAR